MKTLLVTIALLIASRFDAVAALSSARPTPGDSATYKLTVSIANIARRTGMIYVGLANSDATFGGNFYRKTRVEVPATGDAQVSFDGLSAGRYAVQVYQDTNSNQKLDFSGQVPTEPYGFSNGTMLMGPPSFGRSAFTLDSPKTVAVSLIGQ